MKKLVRAGLLTVVMFVGANAQAVRDQNETVQDQQTAYGNGPYGPGQCYYINGQWFCES